MSDRPSSNRPDRPYAKLTDTELRVAHVMRRDPEQGYAAIAREAGVPSIATVRVHVGRIAGKLPTWFGVPVKNRVALWVGSSDGRDYLDRHPVSLGRAAERAEDVTQDEEAA